MKMKQLKAQLAENSFSVSERMIKYYIQTKLLPLPEYTGANQAEYSRIHLIRLMRICSSKKNGMTFTQIKEKIAEDDEKINALAKKRGISREEAALLDEVASREYTEYLFSEGNTHEVFTKEQLLKKTMCDDIVFRLAADTGAIDDKAEYSHEDMLVLMCITDLFKASSQGKSDIIEKISDISKINNMASQLAAMFTQDREKTWIYRLLAKSLIREKLKANEDKTTADA